MPTFFPPFHTNGPKSHPNDPPWLRRALSFYSANPTGINVWILIDNTVTTVQPMDPSVVRRELLGAHFHDVSEEEAALLTAAGYEVTE